MERSKTTNLSLKNFTSYTIPTPQWHLPVGILLELTAWAILSIGTYYAFRQLGPKDKFAGRMLTMALVAIFYFAVDMAKRLRLNTQQKLLSADNEPILYVRPFLSESRNPTDSAIATAIKDIGPLVAVGAPKETLPPVGALRLYFNDEEWQAQVTALMSISKLVIIQPGRTQGIEWEMKAARQYFDPDQIYISFLGWDGLDEGERFGAYLAFKNQLERVYCISLPRGFDNSLFIYFDDDWSPNAVTISRLRRLFLNSKLSHFTFSSVSPPLVRALLRPIFRKRGVKLSMWRTMVRIVIARSMYCVILYHLIFHS